MPTRIQSLVLARSTHEVTDTEHWLDAIAYLDADGAPVPLDGIVFRSVLRTDRASLAPHLGLASPGVSLDLPPSVPRGLILTSGNVLGLYAPFADMPRRPKGGSYVFDVIAVADGLRRRVVDGTLTLIQGSTP